MSNLLPEKNRQSIRREYLARFILAGSFLAIGLAFFAILALSPSYGVLYMTRPATIAQATQIKESKTEELDVARAQSLLIQLGPAASATSTVSRAIEIALSGRPAGVHIDTISYKAGADSTILLSGVADTRGVLDKYRTTLQADSRFSSINLPVGDLIGIKGGRFTITLAGKF